MLRPVAEKLITKAKRGDLHNRREVLKTIRDKSVVHTLFTEIAPDLRRAAGWLHPDHQDRSAQGRQRPHGGHRAGDREVRPEAGPRQEEGRARREGHPGARRRGEETEAPTELAEEASPEESVIAEAEVEETTEEAPDEDATDEAAPRPRSPTRTPTRPDPPHHTLTRPTVGRVGVISASGRCAARWTRSLAGVGTPCSRPSSTISPARKSTSVAGVAALDALAERVGPVDVRRGPGAGRRGARVGLVADHRRSPAAASTASASARTSGLQLVGLVRQHGRRRRRRRW